MSLRGCQISVLACARRWGERVKPGADRLRVEHRDRLARCRVGPIERRLTGCGVTVAYTGWADDESAEWELLRDMPAIVANVAERRFGQRSAKTKRMRAAVSAETDGGDGG